MIRCVMVSVAEQSDVAFDTNLSDQYHTLINLFYNLICVKVVICFCRCFSRQRNK